MERGVSASSNVGYLERVTRAFFDRIDCPAPTMYATRSECFDYVKKWECRWALYLFRARSETVLMY